MAGTTRTRSICPRCDQIHSADEVRAIGRFSTEPTRYQALDGWIYATRDQAARHNCDLASK